MISIAIAPQRKAAMILKYASFAGKPRVSPDHFRREAAVTVPGVNVAIPDRFSSEAVMPIVRTEFPNRQGSLAIDMGCGYGDITVMLSECFERVVGIDLTESKVRWASERYGRSGLEFVRGDVTEDSGIRGAAMVMTTTVLQHMNLEDTIDVLEHALLILKPHGVLMTNEGRMTRDAAPDDLSARQGHMFAKPLGLFEDMGFELRRQVGQLYVWRAPA